MKRFLLALVVFPLSVRADHIDFVTVSATASPAYLKQRVVNGSPRRETYAFFQGKFFSGATRDRSIDHIAFLDLTRALTPNLAEQNYFPARTAKSADLLIVVNWGTTLPDFWTDRGNTEIQLMTQQLRQNDGAGVAARETLMNQGAGGASVTGYNSNLLGYGAQLAQDAKNDSHPGLFGTEQGPEQLSHLSDLIEERYFVILLAYDYQDILRNHPATGGGASTRQVQPRPVWEVRMNVRAAGNNFTEALAAMAKVAGSYYGKNSDGLATLETDMDKAGHVEIGTPKVIGVVK